MKDTTMKIIEQAEHPSHNISNNRNLLMKYNLRETEHFSSERTNYFQGFPRFFSKNLSIPPLIVVLGEEHEIHEKSRIGFYVVPTKNSCERVLAIFLWEHAKVCDSKCYTTKLRIVILLKSILTKIWTLITIKLKILKSCLLIWTG